MTDKNHLGSAFKEIFTYTYKILIAGGVLLLVMFTVDTNQMAADNRKRIDKLESSIAVREAVSNEYVPRFVVTEGRVILHSGIIEKLRDRVRLLELKKK